MLPAVRMQATATEGSKGEIGGRKPPAGLCCTPPVRNVESRKPMAPPSREMATGLAENHAEDGAVGEAERFEDADFADALAHGHRHGVGRDQQDGEHDGGADGDQEDLDVAEEGDEAQQVGLLGFGLGLGGGVAVLVVDGLSRCGRRTPASSIRVTKMPTLPRRRFGQGLLQVLAAEVHDLAGAWAIEDAADGELVVAGKDIADEGDAVADLEVEFVGEVAADDAGGAVAFEGVALIVGDFEVLVDGEDFVGIDGEAREEVLGILVGAAEPVGDQDFADAGDLLDVVPIGFGEERR